MPSSNQEASTPATKNMIILQSSDGEQFSIEKSIAVEESRTIRQLLESVHSDSNVVHLRDVDAPALSKIIQCWKLCKESKAEQEFIEGMEGDALLAIFCAAYHLDSTSVMDVTCQTIADRNKRRPE